MRYEGDKGGRLPTEFNNKLRSLKIDDSFIADYKTQRGAHVLAKRMGIKVATEKTLDGHIRIWRRA